MHVTFVFAIFLLNSQNHKVDLITTYLKGFIQFILGLVSATTMLCVMK